MFFLAAPEVLVDDEVLVVESSDCVRFAMDEDSAPRLVLMALSTLDTVLECADTDELCTDSDEMELELREGATLVEDATLAVDWLRVIERGQATKTSVSRL